MKAVGGRGGGREGSAAGGVRDPLLPSAQESGEGGAVTTEEDSPLPYLMSLLPPIRDSNLESFVWMGGGVEGVTQGRVIEVREI